MKTHTRALGNVPSLAVAGLLGLSLATFMAPIAFAEPEGQGGATGGRVAGEGSQVSPRFGFPSPPRQVAWLGLATEEASEVLASQLQLDPGVGLTVTYIAPDGPAAEAGLQKNDVLVELDSHVLVHPAQLRKLVQARAQGDVVELAYYRAGKRESVSVTLSETTERAGWLGGDPGPRSQQIQDLIQRQFRDMGDATGETHEGFRRGLEEARKAAQEALRYKSDQAGGFGAAAPVLEGLARGRAGVSEDAAVTISSTGNSMQTMVKKDATGTYVVVANPEKHLTAHDTSGKLVFEGEVETAEQQAAVPTEIWQKVEEMVSQMANPRRGSNGTK